MWKKANTIGNFLIDENGVVKNADTGRVISPFKNKSGYIYVTCQYNSTNNSVENLEWTTTKENNLHSLKLQGRRKTKKFITSSKKNVVLAYTKRSKKVGMFKDGELIKLFNSISQASRETKCSRQSIENRVLKKICSPLKGYEWSSVNG